MAAEAESCFMFLLELVNVWREMTETMNSPFVDVKAVADYLGINKELVYRLCNPKKTKNPMPHFRLGKKMKFRIESPEFQAWIQRQQVNVSSEIVERTKASE